MKLYIGCSGWYYYGWKGIFYPDDITKEHWFKFYSNRFNTVELNSTFYNVPKVKTIES